MGKTSWKSGNRLSPTPYKSRVSVCVAGVWACVCVCLCVWWLPAYLSFFGFPFSNLVLFTFFFHFPITYYIFTYISFASAISRPTIPLRHYFFIVAKSSCAGTHNCVVSKKANFKRKCRISRRTHTHTHTIFVFPWASLGPVFRFPPIRQRPSPVTNIDAHTPKTFFNAANLPKLKLS